MRAARARARCAWNLSRRRAERLAPLPRYTLVDLYCSNSSEAVQALDWMHTSSITVGPDGSYYAALRNVNTILCLGRDGEGLKWSLSPTLRSNFTFASAADHFYNPHVPVSRDASGTRLLMLDDGNNRANCSQITPARTCYSRAIEMHLDFETMVARVAWQFEFPYALAVNRDDDTGSEVDGTNGTAAARGDGGVVSTSDPIEGYNLSFVERRDLFQLDGGNVLPLGDNRTLVAFTGTYPGDDDVYQNASYVFEIDQDSGRIRGMLTIPRPPWKSGSYRVLPLASVGGEHQTSPLGAGAARPRVPDAPTGDDDAHSAGADAIVDDGGAPTAVDADDRDDVAS